MPRHVTLVLLGVLLCSINAADGLKCVVCTPTCPSPLPAPTDCKETHCFSIKHETTGLGNRGCMAAPSGKSEKKCDDTTKLCTEFCNTDGCNSDGGNSAVTSTFNPFILTGTITLFFAKNGIF